MGKIDYKSCYLGILLQCQLSKRNYPNFPSLHKSRFSDSCSQSLSPFMPLRQITIDWVAYSSSRSEYQHDWLLLRGLVWTADFSYVLPQQKASKLALWLLLKQSLILFIRAWSWWPNYITETSPPNTNTLGGSNGNIWICWNTDTQSRTPRYPGKNNVNRITKLTWRR